MSFTLPRSSLSSPAARRIAEAARRPPQPEPAAPAAPAPAPPPLTPEPAVGSAPLFAPEDLPARTRDLIEPRIPIKDIIRRTAAWFGLPLGLIIGEKRARDAVVPRHVAMWLAARHTTLSLPEIARRTNRLDHTTALHAIRAVNARIAADPDFAAMTAALEAHLARGATAPGEAEHG